MSEQKEQVTLSVEVPVESYKLGQSLVGLLLLVAEQVDPITGDFRSDETIVQYLKSELKPALINFKSTGINEIRNQKVGHLGSLSLSFMDFIERIK